MFLVRTYIGTAEEPGFHSDIGKSRSERQKVRRAGGVELGGHSAPVFPDVPWPQNKSGSVPKVPLLRPSLFYY